MLEATRIFYVFFALLSLTGGLIGYVRAGSKASLYAGTGSAVLLFTASFLMGSHLNYGLCIGLIVSVILAGKFVPDFLTSRKFMPAGLMAFLSAVAVTLTILSFYNRT